LSVSGRSQVLRRLAKITVERRRELQIRRKPRLSASTTRCFLCAVPHCSVAWLSALLQSMGDGTGG
jgi:hypothetical protein